jgi:hypothetical protein
MPTEDLDCYRSHVKSFTDEYNPKGATEAQLVQSLVDTSWRLNRAAALEANLFTLAASHQPDPLTEAPDQVQATMAIAAALESQSKALMNLSLHTQRLSRQFERTIVQLRDLQKTRLAQEASQLGDLARIMEMHESRGKTHTHRRMASFLRNRKSPKPSSPEPAATWPRKPSAPLPDVAHPPLRA